MSVRNLESAGTWIFDSITNITVDNVFCKKKTQGWSIRVLANQRDARFATFMRGEVVERFRFLFVLTKSKTN